MTEPTEAQIIHAEAQIHAAIREDGQRLGDHALAWGTDIHIALAILGCAAEHVIRTAAKAERAELLADWLEAFKPDGAA
jgi:hypothetical protein